MASEPSLFSSQQLMAVQEFAHTMIVVDDEATQSPEVEPQEAASALERPTRLSRSGKRDASNGTTKESPTQKGIHSFDAKTVIDNAMDLGIICSVIRPRERENFGSRVVNAARSADIVCLDWEISDDGGDSATAIVRKIVEMDGRQNGRVRLIAIYTGDSTNNVILKKVWEAISDKFNDTHRISRGPLEILSSSGLKIVCLFKSHGVQLLPPRDQNQLPEKDLPRRLQREFATMIEGILPTVAIATIAAIRASTHHVLSRFNESMDGPYFHHRACIPIPDDAEEYAVDVVLSELKSAVDRRGIGQTFAGREAIEARISDLAGDEAKFQLNYLKKNKPASYGVTVHDTVRLVTDGLNGGEVTALPKQPGKAQFENHFTSLFSNNLASAQSSMQHFAALTGVRAFPESYLHLLSKTEPRLGLGTIVKSADGNFLLCLQAPCDSVRLQGVEPFLFVPLELSDTNPDHVVPFKARGKDWDSIGLSCSPYTLATSIGFLASPETKTVIAKKIANRSNVHFESSDRGTFRWIADLKPRRALRTAQKIGQDMGRLGFDEFEPYRTK